MNNGKLAFRLVVTLILVLVASGMIFLLSRSWLHEWAIGLAVLFAGIVGPVAGRFVYSADSASSRARD